jgi:hypothetical protein
MARFDLNTGLGHCRRGMYQLPEVELHDLKERIESRKGLRQLTYMKELKMGNNQYDLITLS